MPTATEIIDMFANFQKAIGREVGELMGTLIDASTPRSLPVSAPAVGTHAASAPVPDITGQMAAFESRIMASIDARLAAFEERMKQPLSGKKRSREPSPSESEVEDTDSEDNEAGFGAVAAPYAPTGQNSAQQCFAPMKGQTTLTRFVQDGKAMADLVGAVKKLEMTEEVAATTKPSGVEAAPAPAPAPAKMEESEAEEEEAETEEEDADEEEEDADEEETSQQSDDADEEELTQITYKGKDYGMDGDGNIYGFDAEGDLIEEPIGKMDSKTNRITFFAA